MTEHKLKEILQHMVTVSTDTEDTDQRYEHMTSVFNHYADDIMDHADTTRAVIAPEDGEECGTVEIRLWEYQINVRIDLDEHGELVWDDAVVVDCFDTTEI